MKSLLVKNLTYLFFLLISIQEATLPVENQKSTLWKISGKGLEAPSYLFGTIHMICEDDYELSDAVIEAVNASKAIVLEIDMDDPQLMGKMQQLSVDPSGRNIKDDLSEEDAEFLDNYLKSNFGQSLNQIGILKPFPLSSMILMKAFDCNNIKQYESELMKLAQEQKKEVKGLESVEFQFSVFESISRGEQIEALMKQVRNPEAVALVMDQLVEAYKTQDLDAMLKITEEYEEYDGFNEKLLDERNKNWIPKIAEYAKQSSTFIAVGSGHLAGENGVISLLRKQGYQVSPIN